MKQTKFLLILAAIAISAVCLYSMAAADPTASVRCEYATIRWAGKENTHIIRPGGIVEFAGAELSKAQKPDRADNRAFYMNLVMNGLTKEGYEFVGMTSDEIVMKRAVTK